MAGLSDLFGTGSIGEQFLMYGVGYEVARALMGPFLQQLTNEMLALHPEVKLSPADLADLVVKGWITEAHGAGEARLSGLDPNDFDLLVKGTGQPIAMQEALFAWRRGYIPFDAPEPGAPSVETAIKTSHVANLWSDTIKQLGIVPIGVADAVDAVVEGQIPYSEGEKIAYQNGISASDFLILFNTRGNPPSPTQLIELHRRGFIPLQGVGPNETTLQQGIYEGATKDKWEPLYEKLTEYLPPPRTITALQRDGVINAQQAAQLYQQQGLSPSLSAAYAASATSLKLAPAKRLAVSQVEILYKTRVIDSTEATAMLGSLGYAANEAAFILEIVDMERATAAMNTAVTRIGSLYIARKIDATTASSTLASLALPEPQITELLTTWDLERTANVRILTPAEVAGALYYKVLSQDEAQAELEHLGYTAHDAWVLLSVRMHAPLPNEPPK